MNLNQFPLFLGILFLATSCFQYNKPEKPENLIPKDKMVGFLIDLKLTSLDNPMDIELLLNRGINPNDYAFKKHHIDSLQFALSHDYYTYYSNEYEDIFTKVIDSLDRLKVFYEAQDLLKGKN